MSAKKVRISNFRTKYQNKGLITLRGKGEMWPVLNGVPILGEGNSIEAWKMGFDLGEG